MTQPQELRTQSRMPAQQFWQHVVFWRPLLLHHLFRGRKQAKPLQPKHKYCIKKIYLTSWW